MQQCAFKNARIFVSVYVLCDIKSIRREHRSVSLLINSAHFTFFSRQLEEHIKPSIFNKPLFLRGHINISGSARCITLTIFDKSPTHLDVTSPQFS